MTDNQNEGFSYFKLLDEAITGMTFKNAGNFSLDGFRTKKYLQILKELNINETIPLISMIANKHTNKVCVFEEVKSLEKICDGVIYKGRGATVFFPGGCPGIAFRDGVNDLSGLLHASWTTVSKNIVSIFLRKWECMGGDPARTRIYFLPAICKNCLVYEKKSGDDGEKYFKEKIFPALEPIINQIKKNPMVYVKYKKRYQLDLILLINDILKNSNYNLISGPDDCTCCNHEKYWCYRCNDKKTSEGVKKHRNAAFIITPEIEPLLPFQR